MCELRLAKTTNDIEILKKLSISISPNVRRVVAKNIHTPKDILEKLSFDPVLNVCYMAINNPKNTLTRNFGKDIHPCVKCEKDEYSLDCISCQDIKEFKVIKI